MHIGSPGQPDREWVAWAEAESVRRLTESLQEIRDRKRAEAGEDMEPEIVLAPPPPPARIIRVHSENLLDA